MRRNWVLAGAVWLSQAVCVSAGSPILPFKKQESVRATLPLDEIDDRKRKLVRPILERPTLSAKGPSESFFCKPDHYFWFLDHPDKAVTAWRKLGAKCVSITPRGKQQFAWADDQGSEVVWETIHKDGTMRVWYAEGKIRPGPVMPLVPVKALVVVHHKEGKSAEGAQIMNQQTDLYVQTDSKTAAMLMRLLGPSSARIAEQGLGQLQLFFSGLCWYLDRHPEHESALIKAEP